LEIFIKFNDKAFKKVVRFGEYCDFAQKLVKVLTEICEMSKPEEIQFIWND
jgi:hypothetical protein